MIARQKSPNPCGPDTRQTYGAFSKGRRQLPMGDHLPLAWSDDGYIYITTCDNPTVNRNVPIFRLGAPGVSSHTPVGNAPIPAQWMQNDSQWGTFAQQGSDGATWKSSGFISVGGKLYLALTRLVSPPNPDITT